MQRPTGKTTFLFLTITIVVLETASRSEVVTLVCDNVNGRGPTNYLYLCYGQTAECVSHGGSGCSVRTKVGNVEFDDFPASHIAGPAIVSIYPSSRDDVTTTAWISFEISNETFPPDKTLILPEGAPPAVITLQCSSNLVNWTTATNGFYATNAAAKFFRITGTVVP